jgi:hypothetical protein
MQNLTVAIYLLAALTVGTVSLMLVLMLWGSRVRREARKPLPAARPFDPVWYLKTKKKPPGEPNGQTGVSDRANPSEASAGDVPLDEGDSDAASR